MAKGTPATAALEKAGIAFTLHEYDYDPGDRGVGAQAAQALGIEPARLLKALMVGAGGTTLCVLVSTDRTVSLKRLAAATGAKDAALLAPAAAERATGYHVGGISPLGQKKHARTLLDAAAAGFATVFVSGGRRGLEIELRPTDLVRVLEAAVVDVT
jgi:Cys-tRNA(Pro)/Cys-tRNA(Cys) deacylase